MTPTSSHSNYPDATQSKAEAQDLDNLLPDNQSEFPESEDEILMIHNAGSDADDSLFSVFDEGESETDDTSSSLFGNVPDLVTSTPPQNDPEPVNIAADAQDNMADPWQNNLVAELQATVTPRIETVESLQASTPPESTPDLETINPDALESLPTQSGGEAELQAVEAAAIVTSAPPSFPKLELPTICLLYTSPSPRD